MTPFEKSKFQIPFHILCIKQIVFQEHIGISNLVELQGVEQHHLKDQSHLIRIRFKNFHWLLLYNGSEDVEL